MRRRALLIAGSAWLAVAAGRASGQQSKPIRRIVFVHLARESVFRELYEAFLRQLRELGFVEGRDISVETSWGEDRIEDLPALVAAAVARRPEVIVTSGSAAVAEFKRATSTIPIVFATAGSPVEQGFVASLGRPGGNITGVVVHSGLSRKLVELLREALPAAKSLAILMHVTDPAYKLELEGVEETAAALKFRPLIIKVSRREDLEGVFPELARFKADALIVPQLTMLVSNRKMLIDQAMRAKMPLLGPNLEIARDGGLLSYGTAREENFRRAAVLAAKILRGAKPGDLPVELPEKFELVVNMKTAKAIGVKLSSATMLRATKVIE